MQAGAPLLRGVSSGGVISPVGGGPSSAWSSIFPVDGWPGASTVPRGGATTGAPAGATGGGARAPPPRSAPPPAEPEPVTDGDAQLQTDGEEAAWTPETWAWDPYAMVRARARAGGQRSAAAAWNDSFAILARRNPRVLLCPLRHASRARGRAAAGALG
jgi:hypothetical protein